MDIEGREHQLLLKFDREPLHHTHLQEPPYFRDSSPDDPVDEFPSPREAFQTLVNPLLEQGFSEEQINPQLYKFITKQRWFLLQLIKRIQAGRGVDIQQQQNATAFRQVFDELTAFEHAWYTFELKISPLSNSQNIPICCRKFAKWFRGRMGRFRRDMPKRYAELSQTSTPYLSNSSEGGS